LLVGPGGQKVLLMSGVGQFGGSAANVDLTFDDFAASSLPANGSLASGTFKPTDASIAGSVVFPAPAPSPAPAARYRTALSDFNGTIPNGTWSLYVFDNARGNAGSIQGGWSLNFISARPLPSVADLSITATASPEPVDIGSYVTMTVTVLNNGPSTASGVMLTNVLPAGFYPISAIPSSGSVSWFDDNTGLSCNVGTLTNTGSFRLAILGKLTTTRPATDIASVGGIEVDPVSMNNMFVLPITSQAPRLEIIPLAGLVVLEWPSLAVGYILERATDLGSPVTWVPEGTPPTVEGDRNRVTIVTSGGSQFFRLRKP
jgi:uncharacterized repeat protein (TIGR01451 family)